MYTHTQESRYESFQTKKCRILLKERKGLILREVSQSLIHCFQNIFLSAVHYSHHIHHSYSCQCWKLTIIVLKCRETSSFSCMWCVRINHRLILVFVCMCVYLFIFVKGLMRFSFDESGGTGTHGHEERNSNFTSQSQCVFIPLSPAPTLYHNLFAFSTSCKGRQDLPRSSP